MRGKRFFPRLSAEDYMHPFERDSLINPEQSETLANMMDGLSDLSISLCRQIILGKYVEVTPKMLPRVHEILDNVCHILSFPASPRLFITHEYQSGFMQVGISTMYILMPDLILSYEDDDMLYFLFGNAVGMFKGGYIRLSTVNAVLTYIPGALPFRLVLQGKQRAAGLSSDRAGLLASQNFSAAARCIMWDMGLHPDEIMSMSDDDVMNLAADYPKQIDYQHQDVLSQAASVWKQWNGTLFPGYIRLRELHAWYIDGYPELIDCASAGNSLSEGLL